MAMLAILAACHKYFACGNKVLFCSVLFCSSDIFNHADQQRVTLLALLDLSAAFDCVDHHILLQRLEGTAGLSGRVIDWIRSFLTDRTQRVLYDGQCSLLVHLLWGVLQGSVLGPLLFVLYTAALFARAPQCYAVVDTRGRQDTMFMRVQKEKGSHV